MSAAALVVGAGVAAAERLHRVGAPCALRPGGALADRFREEGLHGCLGVRG